MRSTDHKPVVVNHESLRELVDDLDNLLGVQGNFWQRTAPQTSATLETPDQIEEFARDMLVTFLGLEVQGL